MREYMQLSRSRILTPMREAAATAALGAWRARREKEREARGTLARTAARRAWVRSDMVIEWSGKGWVILSREKKEFGLLCAGS